MKTFSRNLMGAALWLSIAPLAEAGITADEAKQLGGTLTAVGAEKAGNADGSIPAYQGGIVTPPAGYKKGDGLLPDPFAGEKPVASITGANAGTYVAQLTEGAQALLKRYPTFRIDVYPTHRSVAFPKYVTDNTAVCATTATTTQDGQSMKGCLAGFPFPVPKTGAEAMWNHLVRFEGQAQQTKYRNFNVAGGKPTMSVEAVATNEYPYWDPAKGNSETYWRLKLVYSGPARRAGEAILLVDPLDYTKGGRKAWQYLPGQRRVKLAPDLAHDTPSPGTSGASTYDDTFLFNGSMERYTFTLAGKKEMIVPYNDYRLSYATTQDELLKPDHLNPDVVRWEKHRVWVVDAALAPGKRHVYSKRRFYIDEDSWMILAADEYDARGQLYRTGFAYQTPRYDLPAPNASVFGHYDLVSGIYTLVGWAAATGGVKFVTALGDKDWTADAIAGSGLR
ncbi:MAG TPA: DUF1329 domain-containing protein [Nevskiaceae bacterium]|nr:DUF1329 domain-containing protein [Nevskiaceae bacterium]